VQVADFPVWMRALLAATLILFGCNFALLMANLIGTPWKVDPGVATLLGAIVGLGIVGWQARLGFGNLVRSQENQAKLEREARLHQRELDRENRNEDEAAKRKTLLAALRAEIFFLSMKASEASTWAEMMSKFTDGASKSGLSNTNEELTVLSFDAPVFKANISNLGLLGASLAADVVTVCSRATPAPVTKFDTPAPIAMVVSFYAAHSLIMHEWMEDLIHVGRRLRAAEEGTEDREQLFMMQQERRKKKEAEKG
jgi:hypothetical protein